MDPARFEHYVLLVESTYLLHKDVITPNDLEKAHLHLHKFVTQYADFYDVQFICHIMSIVFYIFQNVLSDLGHCLELLVLL
jgi:hypothetical protein